MKSARSKAASPPAPSLPASTRAPCRPHSGGPLVLSIDDNSHAAVVWVPTSPWPPMPHPGKASEGEARPGPLRLVLHPADPALRGFQAQTGLPASSLPQHRCLLGAGKEVALASSPSLGSPLLALSLPRCLSSWPPHSPWVSPAPGGWLSPCSYLPPLPGQPGKATMCFCFSPLDSRPDAQNWSTLRASKAMGRMLAG